MNAKPFIVILIACLLSAGILLVFHPVHPTDMPAAITQTPAQAWWNTDWSYRELIAIDHTRIQGTLTGFPILIALNASTFNFTHASKDGSDLRFIDSADNKTMFPYEIDTWDTANKNASIWVNITTISSTVDTRFWMYYGNPTANTTTDPHNTWDHGFQMVQHFSEHGGVHYDSTRNDNNATLIRHVNQNTSGIIGTADAFNGNTSYLTIPTSNSLNLTHSLTLEGWINPATAQSTRPQMPFGKPNSYLFSYAGPNASTTGTTQIQTANGTWATTGPLIITPHTWHYITSVYTSTSISTYLDGSLKTTTRLTPTTIKSSADDFYIGAGFTPSHPTSFFNGAIDELRVSTTPRTPAWINATYQTITHTLTHTTPEERLTQNTPPLLTHETPANGSTENPLAPITLQTTATDRDHDNMTLLFRTNATTNRTWETIGTNTSIPNGTYRQHYTFPLNHTLCYWSVNATDPTGSHTWTNHTSILTTPHPATIHQFTANHTSHLTYGLSYPVTYLFSIPTNTTGVNAYSATPNSTWTQVPTKTSKDLYNGVPATRYNTTSHTVYLSVPFPPTSDTLLLKITDTTGRILNASYSGIAPYYDDRTTAVVTTGDDWLTAPRDPLPKPFSTNVEFKKVCDACQARHIWFTPGICTNGTIEDTWYPNPDYGPDWKIVQQEVTEGYIEPASHSRNHPHTPYTTNGAEGYDREIGGSKTEILQNITLNSTDRRGTTQYLYTWIEPYGESDATVRQKLGQYKYLCDRSTKGGVTSYASWDPANGLYQPAGYTILWGSSNNALNQSFDAVHAKGGIYLLYGHPFKQVFTNNSQVYQHLNHLANRTDVWYTGMGDLYLYHYMQDQPVITHSIANTTTILTQPVHRP